MSETAVSLIADGTEYQLFASADETAFVLRFKTDQMATHLEGDDAARFRADYGAVKQQFPDWPPDQTLARLWDQGGYSWLAAEEGR